MQGPNSAATAESLASMIKSARDIMRKDKGLNGDLDRLPMLTWVMFLKFLDDLERQREEEAELAGVEFQAAIRRPYRWRDWAADQQGMTGDELLSFVNDAEAVGPEGKKGPGLFAYLRGLTSSNGDRRREVISTVFEGVDNRMRSGYLLRDVVNRVSGIRFDSSDDLHTLGTLYESMLREMRDAAGDSGEFYTPRPLIRFMVSVLDPRLGETILDPAAGTGGFLVEAYRHLATQVSTVQEHRRLQRGSLSGCEAKPLPYLLCQMNLLLHGLNAPQIDPGNALRFKLSEIGERDRVDVILTNPPFGGEEERGIEANFPPDRQTAETALLFLQLIMRRLRRRATHDGRASRAAVIVPDGILFNDGVTARVRESLLREFNLHTIVRLPFGVFAPYAKSIKTNILFFDAMQPTESIWFYELRVPDDRKSYSKTKPIEFDDLKPCLEWIAKRQACDQAWEVHVRELDASFNLDLKNPNGFEALVHQSPAVLIDKSVLDLRQSIALLEELRKTVQSIPHLGARRVPIGSLVRLTKRPCEPKAGESVRSLGVKWWGKGAYVAETKPSEELQAARFLVRSGDLIYNDMWARHGSVAIVPPELDGCVASAHFPTWEVDQTGVNLPFLTWCFRSPWFWAECERRSRGSTGRNAIRKGLFRTIEIPLPDKDEQTTIVLRLDGAARAIAEILSTQSLANNQMRALSAATLDGLLVG